MIGLHNVSCVELDHCPLLCHVTEHITVLRDVTPLSLTCTDISYNMLPLPLMVEECALSLKVKAELSPKRLRNSAPHYTLQYANFPTTAAETIYFCNYLTKLHVCIKCAK